MKLKSKQRHGHTGNADGLPDHATGAGSDADGLSYAVTSTAIPVVGYSEEPWTVAGDIIKAGRKILAQCYFPTEYSPAAFIPRAKAAVNAQLLGAAQDAYSACKELAFGDGSVDSLQRAAVLARVALDGYVGSHTPGPGPWRQDVIKAGRLIVAKYYFDPMSRPPFGMPSDECPDHAEATANARIFAAAPDSYAACKELINGRRTQPSLQRAMDLARIALGLDERPN